MARFGLAASTGGGNDRFPQRTIENKQRWVRASAFNLALLLLSGGCGQENSLAGTSPVGATPAAATVPDLDGRPIDPFAAPGAKGLVLIFVSPDCPISNQYAPEIRRVYQRCGRERLAFWLVYPDPAVSGEDIRQHLRAYMDGLPALRDPRQALVKITAARVTPEVAVFNASGKLVYHGRIDDRFAALGKQRPEPTTHDLRDALDALLAGQPVSHEFLQPFGCYIPRVGTGAAAK